MTVLHTIAEAKGPLKLNAVFMHGLGGDWRGTWEGKGAFWLEWLARDIDGLGVYSLDYDASKTTWFSKPLSLPERAGEVLPYLAGCRELERAPLAFVCHSLGGLVIKEVLLQAGEGAQAAGFLDRVRGIVFQGTPHAGAHLADILKGLGLLASPSDVVADLAFENPHLMRQREHYQAFALARGFRHRVFYETLPVPFSGGIFVVKRVSADPLFPDSYAIPAGGKWHGDICKPIRDDDPVYVSSAAFLRELIESPGRITAEQAAERRHRETLEETRALRADIAREKGVDPTFLEPIFQHLGLGHLSPDEMRDKAGEAIEALLAQAARAREKPAASNAGGDIDAALASSSEKLGRLDTEGALAVLRKQDREEEAAAQRRRMPLLKAQVFIEATTFDEAAAAATLDRMAPLVGDDFNAWVLLGDEWKTKGSLWLSKQAYERAKAIAENAGDERNVSVALNRLGNVLSAQGDLAGALARFKAGLDIAESLARRDPGNMQ